MADDTLQIVIRSSGGDQVVGQFRAVSQGAQTMGTATEQAGKKAAAGLKEMERSSDTLNARMAAFGAVITGGAALLGEWSRSAQDAEAIQRQLEASIVATGDSYEQYADRIEAAGEAAVQLGQDDEAAMQAIAALTQITGDANVALEQMGLVMDLAAAKHISLESAAELVGKVYEGNTGILQRYGIVVEEGATAAEALAAVQQQVAGQAEANATTYARLREEFSNLTDAIGGTVGEFAPLLALLPGVTSGFSLMGSAVAVLAPNLTKAAAATGLLNLAMGPAGLVAAAGLAGVALYKVVEAIDDANLSAKEAKGQVSAFEETLAELGKSGMSSDTLTDLGSFRDIIIELANDSDNASKRLQDALDAAGRAAEAQTEAQASGDLAAFDAAHAKAEAAQDYIDTLNETIIIEDQLKDLREDLVSIFTDMNPLNADLVIGRLEELKYQFDNNIISADDFIAAISDLEENADSYGLTIEEITSGQRRAVGATQAHTLSIEEQKAALERIDGVIDHNTQRWQEYDEKMHEAVLADIEKTKANKELLDSMSVTAVEEQHQLDRSTQKWLEVDEAARKYYDSREQDTAAAQAYLDDLAAERQALTAIGEAFSDAAGLFGDTANTIDALSQSLRENETALQRVARGSTSAAVQLKAFKEIQDGIIASQDPFNQQLSEYGQQLNYLQEAEDLLNQRREEGIALTAEQEDFLNRVDAAQERLTGGQEDATLALGEQALAYAENLKLGDQLNSSMSGVSGAVSELDRTIQTLIATMIVLNDTDAAPSVAIAGLDFAAGGLASVAHLLDDIDGRTANATINVGANISGAAAAAAGLFGGGGLHGGAFARGGMVTIVAGEAGYERLDFANGGTAYAMTHGAYTVPTGTFVTPHPESAASRGTGNAVSVQINFTGGVTTGNLDAFLAEAERAVRARFASLGVN